MQEKDTMRQKMRKLLLKLCVLTNEVTSDCFFN